MSGNNGKVSTLGTTRLSGLDRPAVVPQPQADQLIEQLADRLGERLQVAMRDELTRNVYPRLDEMETKFADMKRQLSAPVRSSLQPAGLPADQQALQRQAQNRVD